MRLISEREVISVAGGLIGSSQPGLLSVGSPVENYCTGAPDNPFGFAFGQACQAHDACFAGGGGFSECNSAFYTALRQAADGNIFGEALALLYAGATYAIGWMWYGFPPQDPFEGQSGS